MANTDRGQRQVKQIDGLPDDVLLEIFDFYMNAQYTEGTKSSTEAWRLLIHVCRQWRQLVLGSPRRLNLRLWCTPKTPAKDMLDIWPTFPLIIHGEMNSSSDSDNIVAALRKSNRVYRIVLLGIADRKLEEILAAMQAPFPELTVLRLWSPSRGETLSVIPDSFLDGSAPRLRIFQLSGIPFPGLPKLHLSANHLAYLWLLDIPHSGYISPEAIVALISVLSRLQKLSLEFQSPQSRPDWESRRPPPSKRSVIPVLISFSFKGVVEYLEDLVTGIDTPQLEEMEITFFNQIDFDTPRLAQFINRTPELRNHDVHVQFNDNFARVVLQVARFKALRIAISCKEPDWQLSSIEQVCNSSLHPLFTEENLYIEHRYRRLVWKEDAIENTLWLQLLRPFTGVKNLYLFEEFAPGIAAALQELVGGRLLEVLPNLKNIFVKGLEPLGPFQKNIGQFVAARQLSDHTITILDWDEDSGLDEDSDWYEDTDVKSM